MRDAQIRDRGVNSLSATLPADCGRDVELLQQFVRAHLQQRTLGAPTPAGEFEEVFLTGATGFIGRFFLSELLNTNHRVTVHCLVRGDGVEEGQARLQFALEDAGLWSDEYRNRIRIVPGDICDQDFGLDKDQFTGLCQQIDAVYHLAADLSLASPYRKLRRINTFGLRNILELSLTARFKHVFFASTMGIFPEYFFDFAREFADSRIADESQPDVDLMKRHFPLELIGYPWSKLVAEQALLYARGAGLPLAIFRLPITGVASSGFTQPADIAVRLLSAVNDVEKIPPRLSIQHLYAPVDVLAEICIAISANPNRRHVFYHCCNSKSERSDYSFADLGICFESASYRSFKRACIARGNQSPLNGYWLLLDHVAPYWFNETGRSDAVHVEDRAITADCPNPIEWQNVLYTLILSWKWIARPQSRWPYSQPKFQLSYDRLVAEAKLKARRMEVDFDEAVPRWMLPGLQKLVDSINSTCDELQSPGLSIASLGLSHSLSENIALARERCLNPEIRGNAIVRPVFILGINRTGTTFLHRLLSRDSRFWTLRTYELINLVITEGNYAQIAGTTQDPRRKSARLHLQISGLDEAMAGIHHIDLDEPEEDINLLQLAFMSWTFTVNHHVPDYAKWLKGADFGAAYRQHHRTMQHFHMHRKLAQPDRTEGQWLLKMPFHMMEIESLMQAYPDALFIQTHRAPAEFMGSWISLAERIRSDKYASQAPDELGLEQLEFMSTMMDRMVDFRTRHPEIADRWIDIRFSDLIKDPIGRVSRIYDTFDWPLESNTLETLNQWLVEQAKERERQVRHQYRLAQYGLTPAMVDSAFEGYSEFVENLNF